MTTTAKRIEDAVIAIVEATIGKAGNPAAGYLKAVGPYNGELDESDGPDDFRRILRGRSPAVLVVAAEAQLDSESAMRRRWMRRFQVEIFAVSNHMRSREDRLRTDVAGIADPTADPGVYQIAEHVQQILSGNDLELDGVGPLAPQREDPILRLDDLTVWRLTYSANADAHRPSIDFADQALTSYEIDGDLVDEDGETVLASPPNPIPEADETGLGTPDAITPPPIVTTPAAVKLVRSDVTTRQRLEDAAIAALRAEHAKATNAQTGYLRAIEPYNGEIDEADGPDDLRLRLRGRSPALLVAAADASLVSESVSRRRWMRRITLELFAISNHMRTREDRLRTDVAAESDSGADPGIYRIAEDVQQRLSGDDLELAGVGPLSPQREEPVLRLDDLTVHRLAYRVDTDAHIPAIDYADQIILEIEIDGNLVDEDGETILTSPPNPFVEAGGEAEVPPDPPDPPVVSAVALLVLDLTGPTIPSEVDAYARGSEVRPITSVAGGVRVTVFGVDEYAYTYEPNATNGSKLGALSEAAATNLKTESENFNPSPWSNANITVTANGAIAPDGSLTADLLAKTASTARAQDIDAAGARKDYVVSLFMKRAGSNDLTVNLRVMDADLTPIAALACNVTAEWQRFEVTGSADNAGLQIYWTDDEDIYAWGAQGEEGAVATSYIKTTGTAATRLATKLQVDNAFANGYILHSAGQVDMTYVVRKQLAIKVILGKWKNAADGFWVRPKLGENSQHKDGTGFSISGFNSTETELVDVEHELTYQWDEDAGLDDSKSIRALLDGVLFGSDAEAFVSGAGEARLNLGNFNGAIDHYGAVVITKAIVWDGVPPAPAVRRLRVLDFTTPALPAEVDVYARGSDARPITGVGAGGVEVTPFASNVYAYGYDEAFTHASKLGALVEPAATNLNPFSESHTATPGATVTNNFAAAPDGTNTAARVEAASGNGSKSANADLDESIPHAWSTFIRSAPGKGDQDLDLDAQLAAGGVSIATVRITVTELWARFELPATPTAAGNHRIRILGTASNQEFYVWGAQIEEGAVATSYIKTTGTTATRLATQPSVSTPIASGYLLHEKGEIAVKGIPLEPAATSPTRYVFSADPVGNNDWKFFSMALARLYNSTGGLESAITPSSASETSAENSYRFRWDAAADIPPFSDPVDTLINNVRATDPTPATWLAGATETPLYIGRRDSGDLQYNGLISSLTIYDGPVPLLAEWNLRRAKPPAMTFARGSTAAPVVADGASGLEIKEFAIDEYAYVYDPIRGELGMLSETTSTNEMTWSERQSGNWTIGFGATTDGNVAAAPDGELTADRVNLPSKTGGDLTGGRLVKLSQPGAGKSKSYTISWFARAPFGSPPVTVLLRLRSYPVSGADTELSLDEYVFDDRWRRYSKTVTTLADTDRIGVAYWSGQLGAHSVFLWGAQVEQSEQPTSYIRTEISPATRLGVDAQILGLLSNGWIDHAQGEMEVDFIPFALRTSTGTDLQVHLWLHPSNDRKYMRFRDRSAASDGGGALAAQTPSLPTLVEDLGFLQTSRLQWSSSAGLVEDKSLRVLKGCKELGSASDTWTEGATDSRLEIMGIAGGSVNNAHPGCLVKAIRIWSAPQSDA